MRGRLLWIDIAADQTVYDGVWLTFIIDGVLPALWDGSFEDGQWFKFWFDDDLVPIRNLHDQVF
jgi:hypothetical protein